MKLCLLILVICMVSCTSNTTVDSGICTRINLDEVDDTVSVFDIFSDIQVIPLEITDSSVLAYVDFYDIKNDTLYILDSKQNDIFIFQMNGRFIKKLDHKGNGPGEYVRITDMNINRFTGNLEVLSANGRILVYDSGGNHFLYQINLPSYLIHSFQNVTSDTDILYFDSKKDDALQLYSRKENRITATTWKVPEALSFSGFLPTKPFYIFQDSLFLYKGYSGETFTVLPQNPILQPHHSWDFDTHNFDVTTIPTDQGWKYYQDLYMNGSANQALGFVLNAENKHYYMTQFRYKNEDKILFYDKIKKERKLFHTFQEEFGIYFQHVDDEYITLICYYDYLSKFINPNVLDDKNRKCLFSITEESNPFILRFKFKS